MSERMDPPWAIDPLPWQGERWILTEGDYLNRWRDWFCSLNETDQIAYREENVPPSASALFYDVFGRPPYDPVKAAEQHRDVNGHLAPPWVAFPNIPRGSIGWRMGAGEDYWHEFWKWYMAKPVRFRANYRAKHPEPETLDQPIPWTGIYEFMEKNL